MASRTGGGGYAESRGGTKGDGTGGGGSKNGRDGKDGYGRDNGGGKTSLGPDIDAIISGTGFPTNPPPGGPTITRTKKGVDGLFSEKDYKDPYNKGIMGPTVTTEEDQALQGLSPDEAADFRAGRYSYDSRPTIDGWDILDYLTGPFVDLARPTPTNPDTFENGTWHTYTNPGGVLGMLASAFSGIPGLGLAGSYGWDEAGLPMAYHNDIFGNVDAPAQTAANPDITPERTNYAATPEPVQRSMNPLNNRIGGYSGGGYNMGAFGKKPSKKTNYLAEQLMAP